MHVSLLKRFPVYLASVCWSLQCLTSALTQAGGGGLLCRFACSVLLRGGRGAADKCHWPVWGGPAVFRPHWVYPHSWVSVLSLSTLLRLLAALYGAGPALRAVPVFGYSTKAQTRLGLCFVPSPAQAAQATRSLTGALSPGAVRLIPSAVPASSFLAQVGFPLCLFWELVSSRDPLGGCQPSRISGSLWLETGNLFAVW